MLYGETLDTEIDSESFTMHAIAQDAKLKKEDRLHPIIVLTSYYEEKSGMDRVL